jgi:hypothetical protein
MVRFPVSGINAVVAYHFKVFFRDMLCQESNEIKGRDGFRNEFFVFMTVI